MFLRASVLGVILGACAIAGLHWPLESEALNGLALFLAFTACVYPGAVLAQRPKRWVSLSEIGVGLIIFVCAWLGVTENPLWITVGYLAHGLWDWGHHAKHIPTKTRDWFPPTCATFDIVVGGYAAWLTI